MVKKYKQVPQFSTIPPKYFIQRRIQSLARHLKPGILRKQLTASR